MAAAESGTGSLLGAAMGPYRSAEQPLALELLGCFGPGMLVLADRKFLSWSLARAFLATGAHILWRASASFALKPVKVLPDGTYLAELRPPRKSDGPVLTVRVIQYTVHTAVNGPRCLCRWVPPPAAVSAPGPEGAGVTRGREAPVRQFSARMKRSPRAATGKPARADLEERRRRDTPIRPTSAADCVGAREVGKHPNLGELPNLCDHRAVRGRVIITHPNRSNRGEGVRVRHNTDAYGGLGRHASLLR